jgi:Fur family transcriptional regulator, ferric uptake regulator
MSILTLAEIRNLIHENGMRSTAPRIAVLRYLSEAESPLSHRELVDALAEQGLDRTTVYRNLVDLTEVGVVQRTDVGDHTWRFELANSRVDGDESKHPHFTCSDCGTVSCLPEVTLKVKSTKGVPKSLTQQKVEIKVAGICDACA